MPGELKDSTIGRQDASHIVEPSWIFRTSHYGMRYVESVLFFSIRGTQG